MFKLLFLFIAIWFTTVNISRMRMRSNIPAVNFIIQAIGITGFIYLQWLI